MRMIFPALAAVALVASPASAQLVGGGLVVVNVSNVANNLARDLSVNVEDIPVTVSVPIGIAATVCDVNANVLAQQRKDGGATCDAQNTSTALTRIVGRQMGQ